MNNEAKSDTFEDGDPIGDILFNCLGALILLFSFANFQPSEGQEVTLPDVVLPNCTDPVVTDPHSGGRVGVHVTVLPTETGELKVFVENQQVNIDELESHLARFGGLARVELRCHERLYVADRNKIIGHLLKAGIRRVADVVKI